jgi:hypothetical protein
VAREGARLTRRHRAFVYLSCAVLFLSGAAWVVAHTWMRLEGEFGDMPHPLERWSLQLHGAVAMLFLITLGSLIRGHILVGWNAKRSRLSGTTMVAAGVALMVSGWCLYYVGNEEARPLISQVHWVIGLAGPIMIGAHVLGRRSAAVSSAARRNIPDAPEPDNRDSSPAREWSASSRPEASSSQSPACTAS